MPEPDSRFMLRALALAEQAWGMTSPNPMVGAVLTAAGEIVGEGFHHRMGEAHAEINALADARQRSADFARADDLTMFVSLEPCSTGGRTPPCTDAIIGAGIKRVVIGCLDPNPVHSGKGVQILETAGITVKAGVEERACQEINAAFFHWITHGRPLVILKLAMTLDGKIATAAGQSQWITGPVARQRVQRLRQWADAIMVGGGTARLDHPSLTVREPEDWPCQPHRLVASRSLSVAELNTLLGPGLEARLIAAEDTLGWLKILQELGDEDICALLVEGGGELAAVLLQAGIVNQIEFHLAPKILGGKGSRAGVGGPDPADLAAAYNLKDLQISKLGEDICLKGIIN